MKTKIDKSDADIKKDVLSELKYEPSVKATDIGVLVKEGTVTLNGEVPVILRNGTPFARPSGLPG